MLFFLTAALAFGENFKLYLKDGDFHMIREYHVEGNRIRYYSTERSQWEEIPVALVDLTKTENTRKEQLEKLAETAREEDEEEKAERALKREIASIPMDPGAYYELNGRIEAVPSADYQIITDKKRRTLQILSPVPLVPGKASVVVKGDHATFSVTEERPSFYLRLAKTERFGIIRLTPKKDTRVVENISIVPLAKQTMEQRDQMDTFDEELTGGLFRVWPEKSLTPGQYALVEFADSQETNDVQLLVWDFAYQPAAK